MSHDPQMGHNNPLFGKLLVSWFRYVCSVNHSYNQDDKTQCSSSSSSTFQNLHFYNHSFTNALVLRALPPSSFPNLLCWCFDRIPLFLLKTSRSIIPTFLTPNHPCVLNLFSPHLILPLFRQICSSGLLYLKNKKNKRFLWVSLLWKRLFSQLIICQLIAYSLCNLISDFNSFILIIIFCVYYFSSWIVNALRAAIAYYSSLVGNFPESCSVMLAANSMHWINDIVGKLCDRQFLSPSFSGANPTLNLILHVSLRLGSHWLPHTSSGVVLIPVPPV